MSIAKRVKSLLSFLTAIPIGEKDFTSGASIFYLVPLVGLFEGGLISVALNVMKILGLHADIVAVLYVALHVIVTGGIHLDGYADYLDVIGSRRRGDEALRVMKDPRKGPFSITVLTLSLMISYVSMKKLISLDSFDLTLLLTSLYTSAAESMYVTAFIGREEPYEGLGREFSRHAKLLRNVIINLTTYCVIILTLIIINTKILPQLLVSAILTALIPLLTNRDSSHRLGFVTGDVMGFTYELLRVVGLLTLSVIS